LTDDIDFAKEYSLAVSGPKWAQDTELLNWEQIQARLRVGGGDFKEANNRCHKDLVSKSKGETYYQVDDPCFLVSKGVLVKCP
jgi:hypothetical protein